MTRTYALAVGLLLSFSGFADIVPVGPVPYSGTGLGSVNTVLTIQDTPEESGCVSWNGTEDVIGAAACPPGIPGGDELTGSSQTQTHTIAELGLTTAADLRIVLNLNENEIDPVVLERLVLRILSPAGAVLFDSGEAFIRVVDLYGQGTGTAGYAFQLTPAQAAQAQAVFAPTNRIALAATISDTTAGHDTFFVADVAVIGAEEASADLSITKTAPATAIAGNSITYTATVTNLGTADATNVRFTDVLPAGTTFTSIAEPAGWTCTTPAVGTNGSVVCTAATMAAGATVSFPIVVRTCGGETCGTNLINTATVSSATFDAVVANNRATATTTMQAQSDLAITKSADPMTVVAGGAVTFTIVVENFGPSSSAGTVVTDTLPVGFTATSATSTLGTCSTATPGVVTCNLGTLASPNQCGTAPTNAQITIIARAPASAVPGSATNTATVASANCLPDSAAANNTASVTFALALPQVAGVPTASEWALILLGLGLAAAAMYTMKV